MLETNTEFKINVTSETGRLRCLIIHSPDSGLGNVVPSKAQDWLFEDIVHLETVRKKEYDFYVKLLMYFLDPKKIKGKLNEIDETRNFYKPDNPDFHHSDKVIEFQVLLADILQDNDIRKKLTAAVCAIESCTYRLQQELIETNPVKLAKILISGSMGDGDDSMIFAPIPNLIFTRDIGIAINGHILLNKPAKAARLRETLLARYIFFNHRLFENYRKNIIEIPNTKKHFLTPQGDISHMTTLEGGDVMVVSKDHLLIGCSERTSASGINEVIKSLFDKNVVKKVTVIKIPQRRDFMHIDTIFTQVKRNVWVLLESLGKAGNMQDGEIVFDHLQSSSVKEKVEIYQFIAGENEPLIFKSLEALLDDISKHDLGCPEPTRFIYSGNSQFPFDAREQWTDSCNLFAIKEGVVLGYDRNDKTAAAFENAGFSVKKVADLLDDFENEVISPDEISDTLILIPSSELSRARGGFHCMSMPLLRDDY